MRFLGKTVRVAPSVLIAVTNLSSTLHEHQPALLSEQQALVPYQAQAPHQQEPPHREIDLIAGPRNSGVQALPPGAGPMPFHNYVDSNDVAIRARYKQLWDGFQVAANSNPTSSPALWLTTAQAAQESATT